MPVVGLSPLGRQGKPEAAGGLTAVHRLMYINRASYAEAT